jgi:anti-sigma factor RsiW
MNHDQIRELIHSYADGELDAANASQVGQHLSQCEECRATERQIRALRDALTNSSPAYRAPAHLRRNIRAALRRESRASGHLSDRWFGWLAPAAVFALLLLGFFFIENFHGTRTAIADELIANHVRSLLATHLVDVPSSDQHTVKPWFNGKIDFAPPVDDLSSDGFPLIGGRLDYLQGKTVAALVYRRNQHPINLFIAPAPGKSDSSPSVLSRRGYNLVHWSRHEMDYWAVSDLNANELQQFASKFENH